MISPHAQTVKCVQGREAHFRSRESVTGADGGEPGEG